MLLQKERRPGDRSNPSLSQVRTETFRGSRSHYRDWKRIIEAQRNLHKLAMLIYVRCQGEPRQILNHLNINEMQEPGGLGRVMRLQDASGAWPTGGHPARALQHISTLKRLCGEYLREEDKETTISDSSHLAEPVEPNTQDEPYSYEDVEDNADEEDLEQEILCGKSFCGGGRRRRSGRC